MRLSLLVGAAAACAIIAAPASGAAQNSREWPTFGNDAGGARYSPLTQINPTNVGALKLAWTFNMRPEGFVAVSGFGGPPPQQGVGAPTSAAPSRRFIKSEVTPLVAGGLMYLPTPYQEVVALNADTGALVWKHKGTGPARGVEYWPGDSRHAPRIVYAIGSSLVALDAKTGKPAAGFGVDGVIDRKDNPLRHIGRAGGTGDATSPPILVRNVLISGTANPYDDGRDGDIRGFDVITGKQLWRFATIPEPGQPGFETWAPGSTEGRTGVRVWGLMTADTRRGIVYAPVNGPDWNRYGGDRLGDNLYGGSVVALDARTGKLLWHFQAVRHDIWDMDMMAAPTLFDVRKDGKTIPAVGVIGKSGLLFILNRVTGESLYGVEQRPVPPSDVPTEVAAPTQPFPIKPPPLSRQTMSMEDIVNVTPELYAYCKDLVEKNNIGLGGPYLPAGFNRPTVNFPGTNGSVNYGGGAFSPALGYFIINTQDLGQITQLGPRGTPLTPIGTAGGNAANNPKYPYPMVGLGGRFKDPKTDMLCNEPPWARLVAVNVNTGDIAWQATLGVTDELPPEKQLTGRPGLGGPIVTASGLVFIGATEDKRFRAFDAKTGKEVWAVKLPGGSHSVPITYQGKSGKQFVAFPATGSSEDTDPVVSDEIRAYALP